MLPAARTGLLVVPVSETVPTVPRVGTFLRLGFLFPSLVLPASRAGLALWGFLPPEVPRPLVSIPTFLLPVPARRGFKEGKGGSTRTWRVKPKSEDPHQTGAVFVSPV